MEQLKYKDYSYDMKLLNKKIKEFTEWSCRFFVWIEWNRYFAMIDWEINIFTKDEFNELVLNKN